MIFLMRETAATLLIKMATIILICLAVFLSLVNDLKLNGVLTTLVNYPALYYHLFIWFLLMARLSIWLWSKRWFLRALISRFRRWIDEEDRTGPGSRGSGNGNVNQSRRYSTSAAKPRAKSTKLQLAARATAKRVRGIFSSITEFGAMVSLDGGWSKGNAFATEELALSSIQEEKSGVPTRIRKEFGPNGVLMYRVHFKQSISLSDLFYGFGWRVIATCFPGKGNLPSRLRTMKRFSGLITRMYRTNGSDQVVAYLKAGQLAIQKAIAHDRIDSMRVINKTLLRSRLSQSGLPVFIPSRDRKLICAGTLNGVGINQSIIRYWLTLFSVYRVILIPGELKLATIVSPSSANPVAFSRVVSEWKALVSLISLEPMPIKGLDKMMVDPLFNLDLMTKTAKILFLETASATQKVSWTGLVSDAALLQALGLGGYVRQVLTLLSQRDMLDMFNALTRVSASSVPDISADRFITGETVYTSARVCQPQGLYAGKLSIKVEPAGKLRVFAMVTVWDQMILKPIHDMLFAFLKGIPNDGTFNQVLSEKRARVLASRYGRSFGYDLSAATDRLPLVIQAELLNFLIPGLGTAWSKLLTRRKYYLYLPKDTMKSLGIPWNSSEVLRLNARGGKAPNQVTIDRHEFEVLYDMKGKPYIELAYAVGQPMGALSSWAMLAVTHHLIVQMAYRRAYLRHVGERITLANWYTDYEILGDDIILFDPRVAAEYLRLMEDLGVPINTTKSVVANVPATEFAKVTSLWTKNVSALSWKMFMMGNNFIGRVNIVYSLLIKGYISKGIIPWIKNVTRLSQHKQGYSSPTLIALWTMLSNQGHISISAAFKGLFSDGHLGTLKKWLFESKVVRIERSIPPVLNRPPDAEADFGVQSDKAADAHWEVLRSAVKDYFLTPLVEFKYRLYSKESLETIVWKTSCDVHSVLLEKIGISEAGQFQDYLYDGYWALRSEPSQPYHEGEADTVDMVVLCSMIYNQLLDQSSHLLAVILQVERNDFLSRDLEDLISLGDKLDRFKELMDLVPRYLEKIDPDSDQRPAKQVRPTDLKILLSLFKQRGHGIFPVIHQINLATANIWHPNRAPDNLNKQWQQDLIDEERPGISAWISRHIILVYGLPYLLVYSIFIIVRQLVWNLYEFAPRVKQVADVVWGHLAELWRKAKILYRVFIKAVLFALSSADAEIVQFGKRIDLSTEWIMKQAPRHVSYFDEFGRYPDGREIPQWSVPPRPPFEVFIMILICTLVRLIGTALIYYKISLLLSIYLWLR